MAAASHRHMTGIMAGMRIRILLDPDVAEQVRSMARRGGLSFSAALHAAIRAGLAAARGEGRPYTMPARPMGLRQRVDLTHAVRIADAIEDEETVRKLALGK